MTARRIQSNTLAEAWLLDEHDRTRRCQWPTAARAGRLADILNDRMWGAHLRGEGVDHDDIAIMSVLDAYVHLLTHPAGTEAVVQRLRALRRAEREHPDEGTESVPTSTPRQPRAGDHVQRLTTRDRDDRPITPTCVYCGRPQALCKGSAE